MYNGLLNIHKEAGFTSNDVVAKLRGILHQKKIGHTGTLDPDAVGVLVVCLGTGTRLVEMLTDHDKEYIAVVRLGVTTDTQDLSGTVLEEREVTATLADVREALQAFQGEYEQVPPMYSAIKVDGKRLYELARQGKTVERKARKVKIHAISLLDATDFEKTHTFTMEVKCSKGTYIRTLCADIGERLGCGASMAHLTRTSVGAFHLQDALTLSEVEAARDAETLDDHILPVDHIFRDLDMVHVKAEAEKLVNNGNPFRVKDIEEEGFLAYARNDTDCHPERDFATDADCHPEQSEGSSFTDGERVRVYRSDNSFVGIYRYDARKKQFMVDKMLG